MVRAAGFRPEGEGLEQQGLGRKVVWYIPDFGGVMLRKAKISSFHTGRVRSRGFPDHFPSETPLS